MLFVSCLVIVIIHISFRRIEKFAAKVVIILRCRKDMNKKLGIVWRNGKEFVILPMIDYITLLT
jgi:hypothetical protein